jgi:hypothetical protein
MSQRPGWIVVAVVAAIVIVVEAPILLGGRTWADRPYQTEVVPARAAAGAAWAAGRTPDWWDGSGLGVPLAAEPAHGALYPPLALVGLGADALPVLDALVVLHVLLAAIGLAMWARRRYERGERDDEWIVPLAIAVGGAALGASGALHAALLAGGFGVAWLPWVAWAADGLASSPSPRGRALAIAATIGAAGLAGPPAAAIDAAVLALVIAVAGAPRGARARVAGLCAAAIGAGALACAAAWWPAIAHRTSDVASSGAVAPTPLELLGWLAPAGAARFHLGAAWLALAVIGAPRAGWPIALVAVGAVALAFAPAITAAEPAVHLAVASIALIGLGTGGLIRLWREPPKPRAAALLGAAAVVIAAALAARHAAIAASIGELIAVGALIGRADGARALLVIVGALALSGPGLLTGRDAAPLLSRAALLERPVLAPPPGARVYRPRTMDTDTAGPAGRPVRIDRDAALAGNVRDPDERDAVDAVEQARDDHATLWGDVAARFGAATAQTADPARRAIEDDVWRGSGSAGGRLFDRFGIDWAILPASVVTAQQAAPLARRGRWALAEQHPLRGPAYVAARTRGAATIADELVLTSPPADERTTRLDTVVIAGAPDDDVPPTPVGRCTVARLAPEHVEVTCLAVPAGWAVLNDAWAPGWSVTVDGVDAEVVRADAMVRAVRVGAGDHVIVWRYRAPGLALALLISGLAWLHLAFGAWLVRRRRRREVL